jgi:hypothetical protein
MSYDLEGLGAFNHEGLLSRTESNVLTVVHYREASRLSINPTKRSKGRLVCIGEFLFLVLTAGDLLTAIRAMVAVYRLR